MEGFECYEYVIKPKKDAKNKMLRVSFILLYFVFVIGCLVFGFLTGLIPLLALVPIALWVLIFFTWRYTNVEYEYSSESGVITFTKIYNNRTRKTITQFDIRSAEYIAPAMEHETVKRVEDYDPMREYSFVSSMDDSDAYTALYVNEEKERCAISFIAYPRLKKSLRLYNAAVSKIR